MTTTETDALLQNPAYLEAENTTLKAAPGNAQYYQNLFDSVVDFAIVATDGNGVVTDWNPDTARMFG
jgi:PAS domain-containing protein